MIHAFLARLGGRAIAIIAVILLIAVLVTLHQCQNARTARTEARLSEGQAGAASDSARDAIGTVGAVSGRDTATDDLTRENEADIRAAHGADTQVTAEARGAGIAALCKRQAYANDLRCAE